MANPTMWLVTDSNDLVKLANFEPKEFLIRVTNQIGLIATVEIADGTQTQISAGESYYACTSIVNIRLHDGPAAGTFEVIERTDGFAAG